MKKKLLSAILSVSMVFSTGGMSVLASSAGLPYAKETDVQEAAHLKLWYDEPASRGKTILGGGGFGTTSEDNQWQQFTLPLGNSFMGANVYGEIGTEHLTFNQKSLWNGGPSESRKNYKGGNKSVASNGEEMSDIYEEVVNLFLAGKDSEAFALCGQLTGENSGYGAYQSWGDIYLKFAGFSDDSQVENYERNLDMTEGVANVDFTADGTDYHREYFISYPNNVLAIKLTAKGGKKLNVNVSFPVDNAENVTSKNLGKDVTYTADAAAGTIVTAGRLQDNQMKMNSMLQVVTSGEISANADGQSLDISGADEAVIFVSADTDYDDVYPSYRTGETDEQLADSVAAAVAAAKEKGYDGVKADHLEDYQGLFARLNLDLGQAISEKTTDDLLSSYKADTASEPERRLLEVLLYQYGRYLTITSSREGDLPSNLQGVWQNRVGDANRVPWGSDYHMNVNLQMNYWPAYASNLSECATPLIDYVDALREPGRVTAEDYYGITSEDGEENGFTAHTQNTPFGWTCPGWDFSWGWSPAAVPWILQNCWEYYEYTGDIDYMKEKIYPMLREEAILYDQLLVDSGVEITLEDGTKSTRLVSAPAYSPEHGPRTLGNAYEQELIWQLYEDTITAAELLGVDQDLMENWKETQGRLAPIEVGDSGQIKEWYHETTLGSIPGAERSHRHMSHLLGLYPGDLISVDNDEYMDAAVISLTDRGMNSVGWGVVQRMLSWARLGNGNKPYQLIKEMFRSNIYPNLWGCGAPFQIDENFGYTAGINEMLMQSNMGYINILPALPAEWPYGSVDGMLARGNFELDIDWADEAASSVEILSKNGGDCAVQYAGISNAVVTDSDGKAVETKALSRDRISFETAKGETYTITGFSSLAPAPENGAAEWYGGDSVTLSWDAVEGAESYCVYRQDNGKYVKAAEGIADTSYTDLVEDMDASAVRYKISAIVDGTEGKQSEPIVPANLAVRGLVDDRDSSITYKGGWGDWSEDKHYGGTVKFNNAGTAGDSITFTFGGNGIDVYAPKNTAYGIYEVYIDGEKTGEADCYSPTSDVKQLIYSKKDLVNGMHTIQLISKGAHSENSAGNKLEFDAFYVYGPSVERTISFASDRPLTEGTLPEEITAESGSVIILPEETTAKAAGYVLTGWTDGSKTYEPGEEYTVTGSDKVLKAVWTRIDQAPLPKKGWTAVAGSEQNSGTDGPASWAIDGNTGTIWHTNYSDPSKMPDILNNIRNDYTIDFGKDLVVGKFEYIPRQQQNGRILGYKIYYSPAVDGDDFVLLTEGTWANDATAKFATFEDTTMRRIQIRATSTEGEGGNKHISAAEFNVYTNKDASVIDAESITMEEALELASGEKGQLHAVVAPENATYKDVTYTSANRKLAEVSADGVVTANRLGRTGTVEITATTADGGHSAVCVVTVKPLEVDQVTLDKDSISLEVGESANVKATVTPYYATDKSVTWSSSDSKVASVENGTVTALKKGEAVITAKASNGKTAACTVTVAAGEVDRSELEKAIDDAKAMDLEGYTEESIRIFRDALEKAEQILADETAEQKAVEAALRELQAAAAGLTPKDEYEAAMKAVEAAAKAAQEAQTAAEEAKAKAETAQKDAEAAAERSEAARQKAAAARAAAEELAAQADADKNLVAQAKEDAVKAQEAAAQAKLDAENAKAQADNARQAAQTAADKAETARTAAEKAAEAAETAKDDAVKAKELAEAAQRETEKASTGAQEARDAAAAAQKAAQSAGESAAAQAKLAEAAAGAAEAAKRAAEAAAAAAEKAKEEAEKILEQAREEVKRKEAQADEILRKALEQLAQTEKYVQIETFKRQKAELGKTRSTKKKTTKITWKQVEGAEGYELQYGLKASFKGAKTVTVKKGTAVSRTIKKLKSKKVYYVRVKAYQTVDGEKIYTQASAKKKVRIK
ncbi:glycosyl hydrolase family 95 catalytic domain-containing protein [Blautia sp.]|uniref:glycosyl hydrolase family 95 catalytic domain-containing protein n=1 Tax=Blautia sp. TaxID=1955243 RepID=UPI0025BBCBD3|nr:glycoside hydrolase N-terminal domain-containing protein [Blautia sp.]